MSELSHQNEDGSLNMVNVGDKSITQRTAVAQGRIYLNDAYAPVKEDRLKKGSVIECARIAGIMAAKNTSNLIPLCHSLIINCVKINFEFEEKSLLIRAEVECDGKTGVEMEALTAVSVSCLTVYDMAKAVDKTMVISDISLVSKKGGKSGNWNHEKNKS